MPERKTRRGGEKAKDHKMILIKRTIGVEKVERANCGQPGHISKDCRQPRKETRTCYICNQKGHLAADCQSSRRPNPNQNPNNNNNNNNGNRVSWGNVTHVGRRGVNNNPAWMMQNGNGWGSGANGGNDKTSQGWGRR